MSPTVSEVFRRSVRHPRNPVSAGDLWRRGRRRRVTRMVGVLAGGTLVAVVAIGAVAQLVSRPSVVEVVAPPDEEVNRACSPEPPSSEGWTAWPVTLDEDAFTVDVDRFNEFLHDATPPVSTSPCDAARVFARLDQPSDEPDDAGDSPQHTHRLAIHQLECSSPKIRHISRRPPNRSRRQYPTSQTIENDSRFCHIS
jgi:hypothetical protein